MHFKMLSAICFNLDQSKILSSGNGLINYCQWGICMSFAWLLTSEEIVFLLACYQREIWEIYYKVIYYCKTLCNWPQKTCRFMLKDNQVKCPFDMNWNNVESGVRKYSVNQLLSVRYLYVLSLIAYKWKMVFLLACYQREIWEIY